MRSGIRYRFVVEFRASQCRFNGAGLDKPFEETPVMPMLAAPRSCPLSLKGFRPPTPTTAKPEAG